LQLIAMRDVCFQTSQMIVDASARRIMRAISTWNCFWPQKTTKNPSRLLHHGNTRRVLGANRSLADMHRLNFAARVPKMQFTNNDPARNRQRRGI
jgi:hypothetical protein